MKFYLMAIISSLFGDISYLFEFPRSIIYPAVSILLLIAFNPKDVYDAWRLHQVLERGGELPPRLAEFPVHPTSVEKYLDVKEQIERFKRQVLAGESSRLCLSSDNLNDLYLQGVSIDKYHSEWQGTSAGFFSDKYNNSFMHFEIVDNNVIHREIGYIDYTLPSGIKSMTRKIDFSILDDSNEIKFSSRYLEVNGGQLFKLFESKTKEYFPVESCYLLENIFKCEFGFSRLGYLNSNEYRLILLVIEKLTNVDVINGHLIIEANNCSFVVWALPTE
jgi:hypothetical protein